jgi:hypothetical protein
MRVQGGCIKIFDTSDKGEESLIGTVRKTKSDWRSLIGTVRKTKSGWRFDPADDWNLNATQLAHVVAILEALNLRT